MVVPSNDAYDPGVHLSMSDVTVDNLKDLQYLRSLLNSPRQIHSGKVLTCSYVRPTQISVQWWHY